MSRLTTTCFKMYYLYLSHIYESAYRMKSKNTFSLVDVSYRLPIDHRGAGVSDGYAINVCQYRCQSAFSILPAVIRRPGKFPRFQLRELSRLTMDDHDG